MDQKTDVRDPDEMEYSLATLMLNIVNDEKLNMAKTIGWQGT